MAAVIKVEQLSKQYRLGAIGASTLRDDISRWWCRVRGLPDPLSRVDSQASAGGGDDSILWALKDVSFAVEQGEVLGIIGRNGAGKSTLLKLLSRVTAPTSGRICVRGRIASLLEVGTGFHPDLTGRENVFLNGAILGMTRHEVRRKMDEIIAFAEIEKFIDTPVKRYSSGMYVRLAFSVAAHLEPEIMIVDEVLAVGDADFQKKCLGKMGEVARGGRTVLFVSHNMGAVRNLTTQCLWVKSGRIAAAGDKSEIVDLYLRDGVAADQLSLDLTESTRGAGLGQRARITGLEINGGQFPVNGERLVMKLTCQAQGPVPEVAASFAFRNLDGVLLQTFDSDLVGAQWDLARGLHEFSMEIDRLDLQPCGYILDIGMRTGGNHVLDYLPACARIQIHPGPRTPGVIIRSDASLRSPAQWSLDDQPSTT